jgi:parallel beta helix pectate lyase-like protein
MLFASGVVASLIALAIPALPAPTGTVVQVATEAQLQAAVDSAKSDETIVIQKGTYTLTKTLSIRGPISNLTLRGATDDPNDVLVLGTGMTNPDYRDVPYGVWTGGHVRGITVANLTIRDMYMHAVIFNAGTTAPHLYNVRLVNAGQQFVKANPDAAGAGVDDGVVEYSTIEYDRMSRDDYTNGIDVHAGRNWMIRHNVFRNIRAPNGALAGPAILMWNRSSGTTVADNTFIDCQREVAFGLVDREPFDHSGGIIRDNRVSRNRSIVGDVAFGVFASPGTQVLHNVVQLSGTYPNAIEYRFARTRGVFIRDNRVDGAIRARDGAQAFVEANENTTVPAAGSPHRRRTYLVAAATASGAAALACVAMAVVASRRAAPRKRHHRSSTHSAQSA